MNDFSDLLAWLHAEFYSYVSDSLYLEPLAAVLNHIQQQHELLLEQQNKRNRSQKMPSRRAQKTAVQQRNLNPVLDLEISV